MDVIEAPIQECLATLGEVDTGAFWRDARSKLARQFAYQAPSLLVVE